jgi:hypothetical protein
MARNKEAMYTYFENVPYGEDSKACEIHGAENEEIIRLRIKSLFQAVDEAEKLGDNETADKAKKAIYHTDKLVQNAQVWKQEVAAGIDSTSNYGDTYLNDKAAMEDCIVSFDDEDGSMYFNVFDDRTGEMTSQTVESMTKGLVPIGNWMQPFMEFKQELINERNDRGRPPSVSIPYFLNNLLSRGDTWKSILAEPSPTRNPNGADGGYVLQSILLQDADENGVLPKDYRTEKESFNPKIDTRLYKELENELYSAFYGPQKNKEDNNEIENESSDEVENLMARIKTSNNKV